MPKDSHNEENPLALQETRQGGSDGLHVAIIMDGNGRWAQARGLPRLAGHERGADAVRKIVSACPDLGIKRLTLFAFSTENWKRSAEEVSGLMNLFRIYFRREANALARRGAKVRFIGSRDGLADDIQKIMDDMEARTAHNDLLHLDIALNYGGRAEIVHAARILAEKAVRGEVDPEQIDEADFAGVLQTGSVPDPDLLIRTSGEMRLSGFLPWQCTYSELAFVDDYWPDFTAERLADIVQEFSCRERRFGAVLA